MSDTTTLQIDDLGVATITINRPEVHNAFDDHLIEELSARFESAENEDDVRLVVIAARGRTFCAGADLEWMRKSANFSKEENIADSRKLAEALHRLDTMSKPTLALIQGPAYGGGIGVIAACDIAIAVRSATFSLSEVKLGLIPAVVSPYVIGAVGARQARRYFLTAERFDAQEAYRIGLVHLIVNDEGEMRAAAERYARMFMETAPGAVAASKDLIASVRDKAISADLMEDTARRIADRRASDEAREGIGAFFDKRKPEW
ncbi:MAG: enoyl-CoA hydratase/isomerase family protein [Alphaproteobacteria bacterium]|jgi:methylglutaconyl-CoA hydratase|nr:enoyl-CoA hydratase/isomerase family protein [Alphaproteobacteria bacterium]MBT4019910.1 enoyl-CoA hydratase/isomerase family protein [Alphaproteobacteria bacterium]MBT4965796.1 enoyl-CoA hydratase/isomerase family protein [Alphaproteobacteria bacterium]MBT5158974.1 enoyl-CoA hydratase/isomerase family protein [Alphaproteobacteria bacterium]MBT5919796.1 enoyl-CoA hydratase/isomerase family protein [Alphaproteobacteria bacterium]